MMSNPILNILDMSEDKMKGVKLFKLNCLLYYGMTVKNTFR
jgi:hypothetical protein